MILRRTSQDFRTFFLLKFTEELIKNSTPKDILLKQSLKEPNKIMEIQPVLEIKTHVKEKLAEKRDTKIMRREFKPLPQIPRIRRRIFPPLKIPQQKLPQRLQYIKPTPMPTEIDLGKLNSFIKDPLVTEIECNGPGINITIRGRIGSKTTDIFLTKEEIEEIIHKFSEKAKIPIQEGIFRVAVGKLIISAIISEITGTRFIISKMSPVTAQAQKNFGRMPVGRFR